MIIKYEGHYFYMYQPGYCPDWYACHLDSCCGCVTKTCDVCSSMRNLRYTYIDGNGYSDLTFPEYVEKLGYGSHASWLISKYYMIKEKLTWPGYGEYD